ncbi:diaminobutyrate--2-oxoglutarate transaminase [Burkholderia ubonensis]|uniref:diaminobutyrate--2-oxoglutarate transaminase n=1 Tax=Burkholderia ubonensis TaxID=101571 RepID=UPI002AB382BF|nr:diaminobutyrate--2-oxoglutarate transaminase [Burkholderia ubonensis]MDY7792322.1 diaminobutyrate--2-oxoglutarate transaminase [Burkholderia ubonensis]
MDTGYSDCYERYESEARSYCRGFPFEIASAENARVRLSTGEQFIDFLCAAGSLNYGHNDEDMKHALLRYIERNGISSSLDFHTSAKTAFIQSLVSRILAPRQLDYKVQFTGPTGANAVEAALKLARKVTGRSNVVAFTNGFHGVSLGALAATGNKNSRRGGGVELHGVTRLAYDGYFGRDIDTLALAERMFDDPSSGLDAPAAFIVETVQGEGGLNACSSDWLRRLRAMASRLNALLIVDDIQAGCGRTGTFFSFESAEIVPDIVVLSKSISGFGIPLSLVLMRPQYDAWRPGEHSGTFRGNNHAFVTGEVAITKFWSDGRFASGLALKTRLVGTTLKKVSEATGWVSVGRGMMQGLRCPDGGTAEKIRSLCVRKGLLLERCGPDDETLKLMPPLTIEHTCLEDGLARFSEAVLEVAA